MSVGQLVNVQILIGPSIQGYGAHGDDPAVWKDPEYGSEDLTTPSRPAVVVKVELSFKNRHYRITVLPLTRSQSVNTPSVSLDTIARQQIGSYTNAHWPQAIDAHCYIFGSPCTLVAVDSKVGSILSSVFCVSDKSSTICLASSLSLVLGSRASQGPSKKPVSQPTSPGSRRCQGSRSSRERSILLRICTLHADAPRELRSYC